MEEAVIDVRMTPTSDDSDSDGSDQVQRGRVKVRVSDEGGSPLADSTITVSSPDGSYEKTKSGRGMGMSTTFENVPMNSTVLIEATGYEDMTVELSESDFGGPDIVRGF